VHGEGPLSDEISVTPASVPDVPTELQLLSADPTHISFSWMAPYDGGNEIKSFIIYWDEGVTESETFINSTPFEVTFPETTYTRDSGMETGKFYRFKVSAVNDIGESEISVASLPFITAEVPSEPLLCEKLSATET
jgi:hypothetical protein